MLLVLPARPRAGDRARDDRAVTQSDHRLGRGADDGDLREAQEVHVRARVEQAQGPVDVVGVGLERQVEALRQHHLEDVAGPDVLLGGADRRLVRLRRDRAGGLGLGQPGRRGSHHRAGVRSVARPRAVRGQLLQAGTGGLVGRRHGRRVELAVRCLGHHHVVHEDDALAPVVEGAELADDDERGVGMAQVVVGHVREALHLAHHVVAEIPDQPPVQRRQPRQRRRSEARHHVLDRGQNAVVRALDAQPTRGLDAPAARRQRRQRAPADERVAAPALAALDRLEEEAVPLPHDVGEAGDRRQGVGDHLAPDRHDGVLLGQCRELGRVGAEAQRARRRRGARTASGGHGAGTPGPLPIVR